MSDFAKKLSDCEKELRESTEICLKVEDSYKKIYGSSTATLYQEKCKTAVRQQFEHCLYNIPTRIKP